MDSGSSAISHPPRANGRIVLAGGKGFLGRLLAHHFGSAGRACVILTRRPDSAAHPREVYWDGHSAGEWIREIEDADAVINLTGRTVDCRYTEKNRREILESRVNSTLAIGGAIANCRCPPRHWFNASTATVYQHTRGRPYDEYAQEFSATPEAKDAFSVSVGLAWEEALHRISTPSTRKIALRTTMVLGHGRNSVFPVLMRLARWGLGGAQGGGDQFVSWIHGTDFCRAVEFLLGKTDWVGPVNLAAPEPLTNAEMMKIIRNAAGAPFGLPAPEPLLEIGAFFMRTETELILKSRRVISAKLREAGFRFQFPTFAEAVKDLARQGSG
ncbi:MAG: TIGR01777 family protein [Verrucomicrobia bacterium]|nr:TIGR01777 family protein [Verrucomicrobiota bacterium]